MDLRADAAAGRIPFGAARLLHRLSAADQSELARLIKVHGYSVRKVEDWIRARRRGESAAVVVKRADPDLRRLERELTDRTGTRVEAIPGKSGAGRLVVHCDDAERLEGIMARPLRPATGLGCVRRRTAPGQGAGS